MSKGLRILSPGILTLLQDCGRYGYQHLGLTTGGAADEHAYLWANRLLDNCCDSQVLECCFGGLVVEAEQPVTIALTGADMQAQINHRRELGHISIAKWRSTTTGACSQWTAGLP